MPVYSYKGDKKYQYCSSLTQRWPSRSWWPFDLNYAGHGLLVNVEAHPPEGGQPFGLKSAKTWPLKVRGEEGRGRSDLSRSSSPAGLCWSSADLVKCQPDEPGWSWTQTWVRACIPDYSLNWIARSTVIQRWQRYKCCSWPTGRCPIRSRKLYLSLLPTRQY